jgi:hypothetical protein
VVDSRVMPSHFLAFILMGIVQLTMAVFGGYIAVRSMPRGKRKPLYLGIFIVLGLAGVGLTFWIGSQTYESERRSAESQNQLVQKLENQDGQLTTIAAMLKVNSNDPAVLASALARALHPQEKLPCLKPVRFTAAQRHGPNGFGYETVVRIPNTTGIRAGTTFQLYFTSRVVSIQSPDVKMASGGSGSDIGSFALASDVPKGHMLTFVAEGAPIPADVKCVDRFDPAPH